MAKKAKKDSMDTVLGEVLSHYINGKEDNQQRMTRPNGWNDITDAYYGKLPADWPYLSSVVDPRIRTSVIKKNARLLNNKLRGRLVPREGGDVLKSRLNNALLDFQWDNAKDGGSMLEKWSIMDQDTRLYASKFGLVKWKYEEDADGNVIFNGNEFTPLDIRDCILDPQSNNVRDAKWFQHREWVKLEDLELENDTGTHEPKYPGLGRLKTMMNRSKDFKSGRSDRRDTEYDNRILSLKGLSDRVGEDRSYPVVELVTEYRKDRWITFAPRYKTVLRDIDNPYDHGKIPVVQLRYHAIQGDPLGESEVEAVLPIWRAIQATMCGFLDNMNMRMRPPLKILDGRVRMETLVFGPEAPWIMDTPEAVTEFNSSNDAMRYFETTYTALVSAFNTAMGDTTTGASAFDPTNNQRTATEIRNSAAQQNSRDQKNQASLAEAIQDMMSMWLANNRQFLFVDEEQHEYILRIVGSELFNYFQRAGLDEMELPDESMNLIADIISNSDEPLSEQEVETMIEAGKIPKFPIEDGEGVKPKMTVNELGDGAEISIVPDDLEGVYDYIPDVRSMAAGTERELIEARQQAVQMLTGDPAIAQLLQAEGVKPKVKELLMSMFEDAGLRDADRYFEELPEQPVQGMPQDPIQQPEQPPAEPQVQQGGDLLAEVEQQLQGAQQGATI